MAVPMGIVQSLTGSVEGNAAGGACADPKLVSIERHSTSTARTRAEQP